MKSLVPGRFTTAVVRTTDGELEARLSEGGHWQVNVRASGEDEWRLLCVGHLDGRVLAPSPTLTTETQTPVKIGPLSIDWVTRRVAVEGIDQELSPREFDLLALLASEPGRLFSRDELLCDVWGYQEGATTRAIDSLVSSIRCKLRRSGVEGFIVNYRGHGYKFCEGMAI